MGFSQSTEAILVQNALWVPSMVLTAIAIRRFLGFPGRERVFAAIALYKAEFTDAPIPESTYHLTRAVLSTLIAGLMERRLR
jgi:hypothetical protein